MLYKILLIFKCCVFVGLDNKLYKMHSTYLKKLVIFNIVVTSYLFYDLGTLLIEHSSYV